MQLIPAIDIRDGRCVRLLRGDFDDCTVYDDDPLAPAHRYLDLGASWLHVVDLDGARTGDGANRALVAALAALPGCRVQTGGGIRTAADAAAAFAAGVQRVVVGSIAVTDPALTRGLLDEHGPERIVLALDVGADSDGVYRVRTHGWTEDSGQTLDDLLAGYADAGVLHVLVTDIARDGALAGPNLALYRRVCAAHPHLRIQASGGVRDARDLHELAVSGAAAAVSGKALLENRMTDEEIRTFLPAE